jgi:hypothetical protein
MLLPGQFEEKGLGGRSADGKVVGFLFEKVS